MSFITYLRGLLSNIKVVFPVKKGGAGNDTPIVGAISLPKTGQTTIYSAGDDGELQKGLAWPSHRFKDNTDGTVTDNLTGLMWTRDANLQGEFKEWQEALDFVGEMNAGSNANYGHTDWRLPNRNELRSLVDYSKYELALQIGHPFLNVQSGGYWSSSANSDGTGSAWSVNMRNGEEYVEFDFGYVWPVRAGQDRSFDNFVISLPITGQSACYDSAGSVITCAGTGQDGEIKAGVAWPNPRFTVGTGAKADCVTDNLTGLMWVKSPDSKTRTWKQALSYCKKLRHGGYSDWRLPNIQEIESLVNIGQLNTATWLNGQGFSNVQSGHYWSSSTYATIRAVRGASLCGVAAWSSTVSTATTTMYGRYVPDIEGPQTPG